MFSTSRIFNEGDGVDVNVNEGRSLTPSPSLRHKDRQGEI